MIRIAPVLAVTALVSCAGPTPSSSPEPATEPDGWSVEASVDSTAVTVGEDLELTLSVRHPSGGALVAPPADELSPFEVLESGRDEVTPYETRLRYRLAAYELPGTLEIPGLEVGYRDASGELASLRTEAIPVELLSSLDEERTEIHDIKEPVALEVPRDARKLAWVVLGLLLAAAAYLAYRRWGRSDSRPEEAPPPVPLDPPDVEAERALQRLADRRLIESSELDLFYTELTGIMKRYAGRRYRVSYLERTTGEILGDLKQKRVSHRALEPILEASDRVKFARARPEEEEARASLAMARELIRETRPAPAPTDVRSPAPEEAKART